MDGSVFERTILSVDMTDQLGRHSLQFGALREGRRGDLDQNNLASPLRVHFQEFFERLELVVHSFSHIELFSSHDNLLVFVDLSKSVNLGLDAWSISIMGDSLDIDSDRAVADSSDDAVDVDSTWGGFETANSNTSGDEVARVRVGLERDDVGTEHSFENLPSFYTISSLTLHKSANSLGRHLKISDEGQGVCMNIPIIVSDPSLWFPFEVPMLLPNAEPTLPKNPPSFSNRDFSLDPSVGVEWFDSQSKPFRLSLCAAGEGLTVPVPHPPDG